MKKILLIINTVKYMKITQLIYRIYYMFRTKTTGLRIPLRDVKSYSIKLDDYIPNRNSLVGKSFSFLNLEKEFSNGVDWNYCEYGKLWTYNLCYFDYLNQESVDKDQGLELINNFITNNKQVKDGMESYPVSLRCMNWIKFLVKFDIKSKEIDSFLYYQYCYLLKNLEYHLLGNHLLENGFSLLWGAFYFKDEKFYHAAKKILEKQLNEQILGDGAHFELSPMYHQIILLRILDLINLLNNNDYHGELLDFIKSIAAKMISWLKKITFSNGNIPLLNDSTCNIAPTTVELLKYTTHLGVKADQNIINLYDSGYRKIVNGSMEIILDVGDLKPDYLPAHSHSDNLNFLVNISGKEIIIDPGISTYEKNNQRYIERSTEFHNTVMINDINQSEVWGAFRVGRRAFTKIINESTGKLTASHNGYRRQGIKHTRIFNWSDNNFEVVDEIKGNRAWSIKSFIHFAPGIIPKLSGNIVIISNTVRIIIHGTKDIQLEEYQCPNGYNRFSKAYKLVLTNNKKTSINLEVLR